MGILSLSLIALRRPVVTLDKILASLFPGGHSVVLEEGLLWGRGKLPLAGPVGVVGVDGGNPIGIDEAIWLAGKVLEIVKRGCRDPILVLIDCGSPRMSKRDELLGLSEFLAHLAKCLLLADSLGYRTIGLLYGPSAAGAASIATAMATCTLLALPGAEPGLDNGVQIGAVATILDATFPLWIQVDAELARLVEAVDVRDRLGKERQGRLKAADTAQRVYRLACGCR
jgi:malonate decarboxylase gamma subunit